MGIRSKQARSIAWTATALILAVGLTASTLSATAASLGGIDAPSLFAQAMPVSVSVPSALALDDFIACDGPLDGHIDQVGREWGVHAGRWHCLGPDVVRVQNREPMAQATVDVGTSTDLVISTTLERISTQRNRSGAGLALFSNGSYYFYAIYRGDTGTLVLGKVSPFGDGDLVDVPISVSPGSVLSVVITGGVVTVQVEGDTYITYHLDSLDPAEQGFFSFNTQFGLIADDDNFSRFSTFRVEALP